MSTPPKAARAPAFTLVEVMVTTSLLFLALTAIYSTSTLAFKYFERERAEMVDHFDAQAYLCGVDRALTGATVVRTLRGEVGFYALALDFDRRVGEETVHVVRGKELIRRFARFVWTKDPAIRDGEVFFPERRVLEKSERKTLLRGIASVTMEIRDQGKEAGPGALLAIAIVRDDAARTTAGKLFPLGGHALLSSREPYLLQDVTEEGDR